jgi:FAD/FMN-containing dehydrogenase
VFVPLKRQGERNVTVESVKTRGSPDAPLGATAALEARLQDDLLWPDDAEFETERAVYNAPIDRRPALIVRCADAGDVLAVVDFAREQGLTVAVRSGGHSEAGLGTCDGGVLIDLSRLKRIDIDPISRRARIEPGLTVAELSEATHAHGLALTSGDTGAVGIGGLMLGGGIGWMRRKYGLAIDRLRAVDLVTADGRLVRASSTENAELFWGLRGGGGNFGVAVAFEAELHPGGTVLGGMILYDAAELAQVLPAFVRYALAAPDELSVEGAVTLAPPVPFIPSEWHGRPVMAVLPCYSGDLAIGEQVIAPLRRLGTPILDMVTPMPYPALFALTEHGGTRGLRHDARSLFLASSDPPGLAALAEATPSYVSPESFVGVVPLGGAIRRVPASATAFAHRSAAAWVFANASGPDASGDGRRLALVDRFWRAMRPYAAGAYVNTLSYDEIDRIGDAYPTATYARLAALKRRYDPNNLFRHNHNISPVGR